VLWIGLVIGLFIGAGVGFLAAGLCAAAKEGDKQIEAALAKYGRRLS
jgi:uncharacterized membrane-anchored protein YhcB (DUF1043 family)